WSVCGSRIMASAFPLNTGNEFSESSNDYTAKKPIQVEALVWQLFKKESSAWKVVSVWNPFQAREAGFGWDSRRRCTKHENCGWLYFTRAASVRRFCRDRHWSGHVQKKCGTPRRTHLGRIPTRAGEHFLFY